MNSWDAGLPSPEMWHLRKRAEAAQVRVDDARASLRNASRPTRQFWENVLTDRMDNLRAIEAEVRAKKADQKKTPDALDGITQLFCL